VIALVDCNNFYVSCERVFRPELWGKPVVVLSNNDGCIISRSQEAKDLGIKMGEPAFKREQFLHDNGVYCFSSNYKLYGDMSQRVMDILRDFAPAVEVYSIDEAFLDFTGFEGDLTQCMNQIRKTVFRYTGIPVSIGIARTKSLAKIANRAAKKNAGRNGVYVVESLGQQEELLRNTPIEAIWGVGRQYFKMLSRYGILTAYDLAKASPAWVRKQMSVVGVRIQMELLGDPCISMEEVRSAKKAIATTRAFGKKTGDIEVIREAVATYATRCAEKLRRQHSAANIVTVFIHTDPFNLNEPQYQRSIAVTLPIASSDTFELVAYALKGLDAIFVKGFNYKKAGVIVDALVPDAHLQGNLFYQRNPAAFNKLSEVADAINSRYGRDTLKLAILGSGKKWSLRQEKLSGGYTTNIKQIIQVRS
jgi:DNA polymerase V